MVHKSTFNIPGGGSGGTVTQINTGPGLDGGPITSSGTISIADGTPDKLMGYDDLGVFTEVTVSTGLSLAAGVLTATGSGTVTSVSGTANRITSTGGSTPVIDISASYVGQSSITTLGTIATGVWNGTAIAVNKIAALTADRAVVTDGSGFISAATTTATEIGYVNGVTSAIQTQLNSKQASGNYITALTGDVTASGPGSVAATLATVNGNVGSFGSSTSIPSFTVNAKGLITAASGNVVIAPAGTLSGTTLNATVVTSSLTSVGTLGSLAVTAGVTAASFNSVPLTAGGVSTNYLGEDGAYHAVPTGGSVTFTDITNGTNTTAAMVVGTGASISASGSGTITATAVPVGGVSGLGTGVATALGVNVGSAGAFVVNGGALGTPASGTATNLTGTATALNIGGTAAVATTTTVANEATDTSCFLTFVTAATGDLGQKSNAALTFNSNTGALGATTFNGVALTTGGSATDFLNAAGNYVAAGGGSGDVVGPASATDNAIALYDSTTGKLIKNSTTIIASGALSPSVTDAGSLGTSTLNWSDLFLDSGGVINWDSGDATITHSANTLAFAGASSGYTFDALATITSNSATAFQVGPNGATNPAFKVIANAGSLAAGVSISGAAAGSAVTISSMSSGADNPITLRSIGTGSVTLRGGDSGGILIAPGGTTSLTLNDITAAAGTAKFLYQSTAATAITASTEAADVYFNLTATKQHSNGSLALQRGFRISQPTYSFVSGSQALTDAATFSVDGGPIEGTSANLANTHAVYLPTWSATGATNGYGITVAAPTGAGTNNFALNVSGTSFFDGEIRIDGTPAADDTGTGCTTNTFNAGATVAQWELVYMGSGGTWLLADADAASTAGPVMLAMAMEAKTSGQAMKVGLPGSFLRNDGWAWTVGAALYVDTTAGAVTETAPSATGDIVRVVGYAVNADTIYFMPSGAWVEVA